MSPSEIFYVALFIATFPTLWLLAAFLDRVLPDSTTQHIARERRARKSPLMTGAEAESER